MNVIRKCVSILSKFNVDFLLHLIVDNFFSTTFNLSVWLISPFGFRLNFCCYKKHFLHTNLTSNEANNDFYTRNARFSG